jgi:hypothetical protein
MSPLWHLLAIVVGLPLMTVVVVAVGMVFASETPRGSNDGWCKTMDLAMMRLPRTPEQEDEQ